MMKEHKNKQYQIFSNMFKKPTGPTNLPDGDTSGGEQIDPLSLTPKEETTE